MVAVIYGVHNQKERNFMVEVKAILSRLAETLVVLRKHLPLDFDAPTQPLSRDAATLHLLLHQVCKQKLCHFRCGQLADFKAYSVLF